MNTSTEIIAAALVIRIAYLADVITGTVAALSGVTAADAVNTNARTPFADMSASLQGIDDLRANFPISALAAHQASYGISALAGRYAVDELEAADALLHQWQAHAAF